jgi:hypothetical protein
MTTYLQGDNVARLYLLFQTPYTTTRTFMRTAEMTKQVFHCVPSSPIFHSACDKKRRYMRYAG